VSGIASPGGATGRIVRNIVAGHLGLAVSADIVAEYFAIATRPSIVRLFARHGVSLAEFADVLADLCAAAEWVEPTGPAPACRDEKDRKYLHCAVTAGCDFIVSRDDDLLVLGAIESIPIVDPGSLLSLLRGAGEDLEP
jgi:putative PIN family toxin of toxin-antitoxin system